MEKGRSRKSLDGRHALDTKTSSRRIENLHVRSTACELSGEKKILENIFVTWGQKEFLKEDRGGTNQKGTD